MVEEQRARVEGAMAKYVQDLDKTHLRRLQGAMHRCSARCCDDADSPLESVHHCIKDCSAPLSQAEKYVTTEMEHLQERLQRCVMECNDNIRDKMGQNPSDSEVAKYTKEFEGCATKCVDKHLDIMPNFFATIKKTLGTTRVGK